MDERGFLSCQSGTQAACVEMHDAKGRKKKNQWVAVLRKEDDKGGRRHEGGGSGERSRRWRRRWVRLCSQVGSVQRKEVAGGRREVAAVRRALLQEVATSGRTRKR